MADRRRANGPPGGTTPVVFAHNGDLSVTQPKRSRQPNEVRRIFLRTGLVPSASGSAYFELEQPQAKVTSTSIQTTPTLKISCAVHGPKPLPRSAPFSSNLLLTTTLKFAPFATRIRRGYIRDSTERDLAVHVETALRSIIIAERWPKSGVDVILTVLEGDEYDASSANSPAVVEERSLGLMSILSGCITAASAALADAGVDCVDIACGGVAAVVPLANTVSQTNSAEEFQVVLDPVPSEHKDAMACCAVGYLRSRDELAEIWMNLGPSSKEMSHRISTMLLDGAVQSAIGAQRVVVETLRSPAQR